MNVGFHNTDKEEEEQAPDFMLIDDEDEIIIATPEFMLQWTNKQKAEFAFQLLSSLPSSEVSQIVERLSPYLHRDIICELPYEISIHILSFLDPYSLIQASLVSRDWFALCKEQALWKNLFELEGWAYNKEEMDTYLANIPSEEDYHAQSSNNGNSSSNNTDSNHLSQNNVITSVPITRTSPQNRWSALYNVRKRLPAPSSQATRRTQDESSSDVHLRDHYDPITDSRYINWKKLYETRYIIEQRWLTGRCNTYSFPPPTCPVRDLHTEGIYCIQFDKDKMLTGSRDKTIKVWDLETGVCKMTIGGHTRSVLCLQYDQDTVVSGSSDASLIITDLETGEMKKRLLGHEDSVLNLRLIKRDKIISCSKDRTVRLWDRNTGECLRTLKGHRAAVNAVQWSEDIVISGSGDRTIKIWDLETGECLRTLTAHTRGVACVEFDGQRIVSGSSDQTIKVWDVATGECLYTLVGHTELVRTIQMDPTSDRIISGCYDGQLKIWNLKEGRLLRDLGQAVDGRILNLKFNSTKLACCSNMVSIVIYDFADGVDTKFLV